MADAAVHAADSLTGGDAPDHVLHHTTTGLSNNKLAMWLCVTALLGACFVAGQVYEFTTFYREGLGFSTSLFSSSFYTLTGFHGVHVTVGIIMLLSLVAMIRRN